MKAAFVVQLAKFAEWPAKSFAAPQMSFMLCTMSDEAMYRALSAHASVSVSVRGHPLQIHRLVPGDSTRACHALFIDDTAEGRMRDVLRSLDGAAVLTIGDLPRFADAGGMIGLVTSDERIGFEVNLEATQRGQMALSAELLRLARNVRRPRS